MNTVSRLYRRRIGEILVNQGVISQEQLEESLVIQGKTSELLGTILLDLGLVSEADIAKTICIQYQLPFVTLVNYEFDPKLLELFPKEFLLAHKLLPFDRIGETILIIVTEIPAEEVLAEIPRITQLNAALYVGYASEVDKFLNGGVAPERTPIERPQKPDPDEEDEEEGPRVFLPSVETEDDADMVDEALQEAVADEEEGQGQTLVFGSGESFLEELDSTWDSIFTESKKQGQEPEDDSAS